MGKEIQTPYLLIKSKFNQKFPKFICIQEILFPIFINQWLDQLKFVATRKSGGVVPFFLAITEGFWLGLWPMIRSFSPLFVQYLISKPNQRFLI